MRLRWVPVWRHVSRHKLYVFDGVVYQPEGWFGCQLESFEWRRPPAGTQRVLKALRKDYTVTVFTTRRLGLLVKCTWSIQLPRDVREANKAIREFYEELDR